MIDDGMVSHETILCPVCLCEKSVRGEFCCCCELRGLELSAY